MADPTQVHYDEFHGIGGSYEVGPDGKRRLVERTRAAGEIEQDGAEPVPPQDRSR